MRNEPTVVGINAQLRSGLPGGVEQFIIGLAHGLGGLADGDEEYRFLALPGEADWLRPFVGRRSAVMEPSGRRRAAQWLTGTLPRRTLVLAPRLRPLLARAATFARRHAPASSDGTLEATGAAVIHFPFQSAFLTKLPTIYQPWDLQHLHLPEFFSRDEIMRRERSYRAHCDVATRIVVASRWVKNDVIKRYNVDPDKVAVIPVPPPVAVTPEPTSADIAAAKRRFGLSEPFLFYPAQTWPHKNHLRLFRALRLLRDGHGTQVHVVCTGSRNQHFRTIADSVAELGLTNQVTFLGYVSSLEVRALYRLSLGLVFPSLFEGYGLPVVEAMAMGTPIACSDVTCLPEIVGDAGLIFDPTDTEELAQAILRLWTDQSLRESLMVRGTQRTSHLSWSHTARVFRAHYRDLAGDGLSPEDRQHIAAGMVT